jgi:aromatic ring-opening dioxygenase catalytic subunit (LigB family)
MKTKQVYGEWEVNQFEMNNPNTKVVSVTVFKKQIMVQHYSMGQPIDLIQEIVDSYVIVYEELNERT